MSDIAFSRTSTSAHTSLISGFHSSSSSVKPSSMMYFGNVCWMYDRVRLLLHVWIPNTSRAFWIRINHVNLRSKGWISHFYDNRLATRGKEATKRELVRSNCTRKWAAVQFVWEGKAKLELFLPCSMCFVCLAFALGCECRVS